MLKSPKLWGLVALIVVLLVIGRTAMSRTVHDWTLRYGTLPATDDELRKWVADQPLLRSAEVARDGAGIHIRYTVSVWRHESFPISEIMAECDRAGYKDFRGWSGTSSGVSFP